MDLDTREIYEYHAGDFFATFPGTTYVQKSEAGTNMIFVKEPSINDKELVPMDEEAKKWMETEFWFVDLVVDEKRKKEYIPDAL